MIAPVPVLGIPIDRVTMSEAVAEVERLVALGRQRHTSHQVVTVNADFVVNALDDPQVHRVLRDADLAIADGMPVVWGARGVGLPVPGRVTGADLVPALAARSAATGLRIHFYGSDETVAERAAALLIGRAPGACITADSGEVIEDPHDTPDRALAAIAAVDADVLCVALGNPKQERFIAATRDRLRIPVMIGVGGTLDLLVGVRRRAPRLVQRSGLEWVYRAVQEPGRLGPRYARDIVVLGPTLARHIVAVRRSTRGAADVVLTDDGGVVDVGAADRLTVATMGELLARRRRARQFGEPFELRTSAGVAAQLRSLRLGYLVEG